MAPETADWHAAGADWVLQRLQSRPTGLTADEAQHRLERYGANALEPEAPTQSVALFLRQFRSPLIFVLLVAATITLALGEVADTIAIALVLLLNAAIGTFQERKAEDAVRALMAMVAPQATVIRDGREAVVKSAGLVPGDVVFLESGARVPADLRLISVTRLTADESLLTGESVTVSKQTERLEPETVLADRSNMAYAGTIIAGGRARGVVVATGTATAMGAISEAVRHGERPQTPLQGRLAGFGRFIGVAVTGLSLLALVLGVAQGEALDEMFRVAVAMAVSAVPEGLPVALTITLAIGVRRMAARNAIVRHLPAVETLGSTTVIGSDKTGTLTENRMTVREAWIGGQTYTIDELSTDSGELPAAAGEAFRAGVLANEATLGTAEADSVGDPTELALLAAARRVGIEPAVEREGYRPVDEVPFEPSRQYSASLRERNGRYVLFVKGAPERVAGMCQTLLGPGGSGALDRAMIEQAAHSMAERGYRTLAMAAIDVDSIPEGGLEALIEAGALRFLGIFGMMDPPREGVREAIAGCRAAGMRVVMITGDHAATGLAIADQLGIAPADARALTGRELEGIDEGELRRLVRTVSVYARVSPEQKLRVVEALRANGDVVAVTGDGINDAPALRSADIGVAMGRDGTDVAREAADMVLADDNFVSIYAAVEEGRVTFDNVRKVTFFLVSTGVAELIAILTTLIVGWPLPFVAAQILWLNLVTNGLQHVALVFEPGEPDVLQRPPRKRSEGLLSWLLWERTLVSGIVMAAGTLWVFDFERNQGASAEGAQTAALTTMVLFQVFHVGNSRVERLSAFRRSPTSNRFLFIATIAALSTHVAALYLAPTQYLLSFEPPDAMTWVRMLAVAASIVVAVEIHKLIRQRWPAPGEKRLVALTVAG